MDSTLSIFDIIGPVMVGPSSSHTAGALKIGSELHRRLQGKLKRIEVTLYNSFADTGEGHGTKIAVVAGVLGFSTEDEGMKEALSLAGQLSVEVAFRKEHDAAKHPNSVLIVAETSRGVFSGFGESLGGGIVSFRQVSLEAVKSGRC